MQHKARFETSQAVQGYKQLITLMFYGWQREIKLLQKQWKSSEWEKWQPSQQWYIHRWVHMENNCINTPTLKSDWSYENVDTNITFTFIWYLMKSQYVTVHEKTRLYKLEIATLGNTYLEVQTLCYFMLKSDLSNKDKITPVQFCFLHVILLS